MQGFSVLSLTPAQMLIQEHSAKGARGKPCHSDHSLRVGSSSTHSKNFKSKTSTWSCIFPVGGMGEFGEQEKGARNPSVCHGFS